MGLSHVIELRQSHNLKKRGSVVRSFYGWSALMLFVEKMWIAKGRKPSIPLQLENNELVEDEWFAIYDAITGRNFKAAQDALLAIEKKDTELNNQFNGTPFELDTNDWNALKEFILKEFSKNSVDELEDIKEHIAYADESMKSHSFRLFYTCSW